MTESADSPVPAFVQRESAVIEAFVHLADSLAADYDVIDFLHDLISRCTELIDVEDVGVMLADPTGRLHAVASSTETVHLLELFEVQNQDGPCLDAYHTGLPVEAPDLAQHVEEWPTFTVEAMRNGFRSAHSLPMRVRDETVGAINLLSADVNRLSDSDSKLAAALARFATIGLLQQRRAQAAQSNVDALQHALESRVRIEQAKGVIAERHQTSVDEAFETIRKYARHHQLGITVVADRIVTRQLFLPQT